MTLDDILLEAEEKMLKTEQAVANEFAGVRTGKASPDLVTNLMVGEYSGGSLWLDDAHPRARKHLHAGAAHAGYSTVGCGRAATD